MTKAKTTEKKQNKGAAMLFRSRFFLALAGFVLVNFVVSTWALPSHQELDEQVIQNSVQEARQQGQWTWWITRQFLMQRTPPDVVVFGSSQMGSATFAADAKFLNKDLDVTQYRRTATLEHMLKTFSGERPTTYNFAMGGAMASDALMFSRALFKDHFKPRLAVIGLNPRDFMDNSLPSVSATEPFHFFSPYVDIGQLSAHAFPDQFARLDWTLNNYVPLKRLQKQLQGDLIALVQPAQAKAKPAAVTAPKIHRQMLQAVLGAADEVRKGEWIVPALKTQPMLIDNTKEYLGRYRSSDVPIYKGEMEFFKAFLKDMNDRHIPVLVVGMPSLPPNRSLLPDAFWSKFRSEITAVCKDNSDSFLDLTDSPDFIISDYLDTVHLNADGGIKLFMKVGQYIAKQPQLVATYAAPNRLNGRGKDFDDRRFNASLGSWH